MDTEDDESITLRVKPKELFKMITTNNDWSETDVLTETPMPSLRKNSSVNDLLIYNKENVID
jgi:hypothetical protein